MKAFAYLRVSSKDQIKGTSLDKQKEICQIIAKNLGIFDLDLYEEPGISGESIKNRPVFSSLLEKIKAGDYDKGIGIAFDQDRLSRRTLDWSQISELFKEHNIRLHTSQGIMDFRKKDQELMSSIKGSLSQWELRTIRERTRDGKRRKALQGEWNGGLILWGYCYNPNLPKGQRLEIDPDKAKLVRVLLIELEHLTFCEMAKEINRRNIPSPKGGLWNSNKVYAFFDENRLLKYSGLVKVFHRQNGNGEWEHIPEGITIKAKWPAIITTQERDRLLQKKESWKKNRIYPTKANKLITGLGIALCGYCGNSVGTNSSHRNKDGTLRAYYGCMNRSCPQKPNFRMEKIDDLIISALQKIDLKAVCNGYNYLVNIQKEKNTAEGLKALDSQIAQIVNQRNTLVEKVSLRILQDGEIETTIKKLRQKLEVLQNQKSQLLDQAETKYLGYREFQKIKRQFLRFDNLPKETQRLGLKSLIRKMHVFQDHIEINLNFPATDRGEMKLVCPVSSTG